MYSIRMSGYFCFLLNSLCNTYTHNYIYWKTKYGQIGLFGVVGWLLAYYMWTYMYNQSYYPGSNSQHIDATR